MDVATISALGVIATGIMAHGCATLIKVIRAGRTIRKEEAKREDARLSDCEDRYTTLSDEIKADRAAWAKEIKEVRDGFQTILLDQFMKAARSIEAAAAEQRVGNERQADQTRTLGRMCQILEINAGKTPPVGSVITKG